MSAIAGFQTFNRRLVPSAKEPRLTIQRRGTISLNESAFQALGSPGAAELLFDPEQQLVGLRSAAPGSENAYRVRSGSGNGSGPFVISALSFLRHFGISRDQSLRWSAYLAGDVLCADISSPGTPVSSNRARHGEEGSGGRTGAGKKGT